MKTKKNDRTQGKGLVGGLIALCLATILGLTAISYASVNFWQVVAENYGQALADKTEVPNIESMVGSSGLTATSTVEKITNWYSGTFSEVIWLGNWENTEALGEFVVVKDFTDATITPLVISRPAGETIYIEDIGLQANGKSTTTPRLCLTTSTLAFLSGDNASYLTENAGDCTLMRGSELSNLFSATTTKEYATGTVAWLLRNPGTDTNVASQKLPIEWGDWNIFLFATTSSSTAPAIQSGNYGIIGSENTFDGEIYLKLRVVK